MRRQEHMACRVALCPFQVISSRGCEPLELCKFWSVVQESSYLISCNKLLFMNKRFDLQFYKDLSYSI